MPVKTKFALTPGPATREAFGRELVELGRENRDIVVCDSDLSHSTMTTYFGKEFPERFISAASRKPTWRRSLRAWRPAARSPLSPAFRPS